MTSLLLTLNVIKKQLYDIIIINIKCFCIKKRKPGNWKKKEKVSKEIEKTTL